MIFLILALFVVGVIQHIFFPETITHDASLAIAPWAIMAGIGAAKGAMDARANRKQQAKNDAFRKTAIAMSPWTGMGDPGFVSAGNTNTMSGLLGGGLQGAALGSMAQSGGLFGKEAAKDLSFMGAGASDAPMATGGQSYLGSDQMSQQLGTFGTDPSMMANAGSAGAMGGNSAWGGMSGMNNAEQLKLMSNPYGGMLTMGLGGNLMGGGR